MTSAVIRLVRRLPADIEAVFAAWSSGEAMSRWFVVNPGWTARVDCDFRVGGAYHVVMDKRDGTFGIASGEYLEIAPPHRLVFTWSTASPEVQNTRVTIELREAGIRATDLTLVHELLPDTPRGRGHLSGWAGTLRSLEAYLDEKAPRQ